MPGKTSKEDRPLLDPELAKWLVDRRAKIQHDLRELYVLSRSVKVRNDVDHGPLLQFLTGVSFSLWRSVFLINVTGRREARYKSVTRFLHALVQDNAITYAQEQSTREWTMGYFNNNAILRLHALCGLIPNLASSRERDRLLEMFLRKDYSSPESLTVEWDFVHGVFRKVLKRVTDRYPLEDLRVDA